MRLSAGTCARPVKPRKITLFTVSSPRGSRKNEATRRIAPEASAMANRNLIQTGMVLRVSMRRKPLSAKIIEHSEGLGTPDADTVRQRAMELARIAGHSQMTHEDWVLAKRELHGNTSDTADNGGGDVMITGVSEKDMVASDLGHHVENLTPEDDTLLAEELTAEGMEEAVHDRMLAACDEEPRENEEE